MTREEALAKLDEVRQAMHDEFEDEHGTHRARLGAIDGAIEVATMHVGHLHDDEGREVDLAQRIMNRDTVHGNEEVKDHSGRSMDHIRALAARGRA